MQGDAPGLYTIQALWTQAREQLDILTLICVNDGYRILELELARTHAVVGPTAKRLTQVSSPSIDWVRLAESFGVPAKSVSTVAELRAAISAVLETTGPRVICIRLRDAIH